MRALRNHSNPRRPLRIAMCLLQFVCLFYTRADPDSRNLPPLYEPAGTPVFFECRGDELFTFSFEELYATGSERIQKLAWMRYFNVPREAIAPLSVLVPFETEYYSVDARGVLAGQLVLTPREGVPGHVIDEELDPIGEGWYGEQLRKMSTLGQRAFFIGRDVSSELLLRAAGLAIYFDVPFDSGIIETGKPIVLSDEALAGPEWSYPATNAPTKEYPESILYAECRDNMLFQIPIDEINARTSEKLRLLAKEALGDTRYLMRLLPEAELYVGAYEVDLTSALLAQFALCPRPDVRGSQLDPLRYPHSADWYREMLIEARANSCSVLVITRTNSVEVSHRACGLAGFYGVPTKIATCPDSEPIRFGLGKGDVSVKQTAPGPPPQSVAE